MAATRAQPHLPPDPEALVPAFGLRANVCSPTVWLAARRRADMESDHEHDAELAEAEEEVRGCPLAWTAEPGSFQAAAARGPPHSCHMPAACMRARPCGRGKQQAPRLAAWVQYASALLARPAGPGCCRAGGGAGGGAGGRRRGGGLAARAAVRGAGWSCAGPLPGCPSHLAFWVPLPARCLGAPTTCSHPPRQVLDGQEDEDGLGLGDGAETPDMEVRRLLGNLCVCVRTRMHVGRGVCAGVRCQNLRWPRAARGLTPASND